MDINIPALTANGHGYRKPKDLLEQLPSYCTPHSAFTNRFHMSNTDFPSKFRILIYLKMTWCYLKSVSEENGFKMIKNSSNFGGGGKLKILRYLG